MKNLDQIPPLWQKNDWLIIQTCKSPMNKEDE